MKIFRIATKKYIKDISGTGAKLHGGRWNRKGTNMLYCAENTSLAILEILVHFDGLTIPENLQLLTLEMPNSQIVDFPKARFNRIRNLKNAELKFKEEGERWIDSEKSLALKVPSIITKNESNIIINPNHENFNKLKIIRIENLDLDKRLYRRVSAT